MLDNKYIVEKIVEAMESKKAKDIKVYNVASKTPYYEYSIICTGSSKRNVDAILTEIKKTIDNIKSVEGQQESEWVLIDAGDIIVSIFTEEARSYYELDELYEDIQ